jgi:hypothetical protein
MQENNCPNRAHSYQQFAGSCKSIAMHPMWQHGRVSIGGPVMTKAKLIRILVIVQCVLGIVMIWLLTH